MMLGFAMDNDNERSPTIYFLVIDLRAGRDHLSCLRKSSENVYISFILLIVKDFSMLEFSFVGGL